MHASKCFCVPPALLLLLLLLLLLAWRGNWWRWRRELVSLLGVLARTGTLLLLLLVVLVLLVSRWGHDGRNLLWCVWEKKKKK